MQALTRDECRPECEDGKHLDLQGNCVNCPQGTYRRQGQDLGCTNCPKGFTTSKQGKRGINNIITRAGQATVLLQHYDHVFKPQNFWSYCIMSILVIANFI